MKLTLILEHGSYITSRPSIQSTTICLEIRCCTRLCFLLYQPPLVLVCALRAEGGGVVVTVESCIWYKHVTGRALGVVAVIFLHNHYCVPYVAVHEVNLEVSMYCRPPLAVLNWETYRPRHSREGDPKYPDVQWFWVTVGLLPTGLPNPFLVGIGYVPPVALPLTPPRTLSSRPFPIVVW